MVNSPLINKAAPDHKGPRLFLGVLGSCYLSGGGVPLDSLIFPEFFFSVALSFFLPLRISPMETHRGLDLHFDRVRGVPNSLWSLWLVGWLVGCVNVNTSIPLQHVAQHQGP